MSRVLILTETDLRKIVQGVASLGRHADGHRNAFPISHRRLPSRGGSWCLRICTRNKLVLYVGPDT